MTVVQDNGIIYLIRGDSLTCPITINIGNVLTPNWYKLQEGDKLYFGLLQPNEKFEDAIMKKVYDYYSEKNEDGDVLLKIFPEDTLKLAAGKYYYMIKLLKLNGEVITLVKPTLFYINE